MLLALKKPLAGLPEAPPVQDNETKLNISVVFTSPDATLKALKEAGVLARKLGAHITLMALQVVPTLLPLTSPPVLLDWSEQRFSRIAGESQVDTTVHLYLCRERVETLLAALTPHSLVVVGGARRWWWPTSEERLAKTLRRAGHEVIFTKAQ